MSSQNIVIVICNLLHKKRSTLAATATPLAVPFNWLAVQWRGETGGRVVAEATWSGPSRHLSTRWTPNWRCRRQASSPATTNSSTASVARAPTTAPIPSSVSAGWRLPTTTGPPSAWWPSSLRWFTVNKQMMTALQRFQCNIPLQLRQQSQMQNVKRPIIILLYSQLLLKTAWRQWCRISFYAPPDYVALRYRVGQLLSLSTISSK